MLLGDPHVEETVRELPGKGGKAGAVRHGSGDGDDAVVLVGEPFHRLPEDAGVGGGAPLPFQHLATLLVEGANAVEERRVRLGRGIPFPLPGENVDEHRVIEALNVLERLKEFRDVVPVDGAYVLEAEGLEKHAGGEQGLQRFLGALGDLQNGAPKHGNTLEEGLQVLLGPVHVFARDGARE